MGLSNPVHLAFVAVIALIFLGPKRLPEVARSIGNGVRELRDSLSGERGDDPELHVATTAPVEPTAAAEAATPAAPATAEPVTPAAAATGDPAATAAPAPDAAPVANAPSVDKPA